MPISLIIYSIYCLTLILASAVTGCCLMRRSWPSRYKLLVIMCCATFLVETFSTYSMQHGFKPGYIYNTWLPLETSTILFILYSRAAHGWTRRLGRVLLGIYLAGVAVSYIFFPPFSEFNTQAVLTGLFMQLFASCASLADMMQDKDNEDRLSVRPMFWMAIAILCSCTLFAVIFSTRGLLINAQFPFGYYFYMPFSYAANTCMYGGFIACFITLKKRQPDAPALDNFHAIHSVRSRN